MRILFSLLLLAFAVACSSTSNGESRTSSNSNTASADVDQGNASVEPDGKTAKMNSKSGGKPRPMAIADEVPAAVKSIETVIDQKSVVLADEAEIHVSKNYQFDVSLTGDEVSDDKDTGAGVERVATGGAIAFVRNMQIRCDKKIRVKIADVGTRPFIQVVCRGRCSHLISGGDGAKPAVQHAETIIVDNDHLRYMEAKEKTASAK